MRKHQLIGTWKLVRCEVHRVNGDTVYPFGRQPIGRLMYDRAGQMAYLSMRPGRALFASDSKVAGTPEEVQGAFDGFDAYFGTYEVHDMEGKVTHHDDGALFPNWVGTDQPRLFQCSDDHLMLQAVVPIGGELTTAVLLWERVP